MKRHWIGPSLVVFMLLFGVDVCSSATDRQKRAFIGAVERTTTYSLFESALPDEWFQAWTDSWREQLAPTVMDDEEGSED